jgi:uracil-DNA glycosylase
MIQKQLETIFETWLGPLTEAGCIDLLDGILSQLDLLYENTTVYPIKENVFRAFRGTPYQSTKAILLGQDPYHSIHKGKIDACGFSFLTENGYYPPSLKNMYKELQHESSRWPKVSTDRAHKDITKQDDLKPGVPAGLACNTSIENYDFAKWTNEVLMLNTYLTVEEGKPNSHMSVWLAWTARLTKYLVQNRKDIVWILLGKKAEEALSLYDCKKVIAAHPSPLAGGAFFNSRIYSRTNELLENKINW